MCSSIEYCPCSYAGFGCSWPWFRRQPTSRIATIEFIPSKMRDMHFVRRHIKPVDPYFIPSTSSILVCTCISRAYESRLLDRHYLAGSILHYTIPIYSLPTYLSTHKLQRNYLTSLPFPQSNQARTSPSQCPQTHESSPPPKPTSPAFIAINQTTQTQTHCTHKAAPRQSKIPAGVS